MKVNRIHQYNIDKQNSEEKIEDANKKDINDLVTMTVLNTKIKEVDNKIPDLKGLVKKTDYDVKVLEIEEKHFTTSVINLRVT